MTDGKGHPLAALITPGQRHESVMLEAVVEQAGPQSPRFLAGDRAYSVPCIRAWLRSRRIRAVIPFRRDELRRWPGLPEPDPELYRRRNVIERTVGWLKMSRSLATRFDKLAVCYLAWVQLAIAKLLLRRIELPDTT